MEAVAFLIQMKMTELPLMLVSNLPSAEHSTLVTAKVCMMIPTL